MSKSNINVAMMRESLKDNPHFQQLVKEEAAKLLIVDNVRVTAEETAEGGVRVTLHPVHDDRAEDQRAEPLAVCEVIELVPGKWRTL